MGRTGTGLTRTIACSCGAVFRGEEEELYGLVHGHIDRFHPEQHQPLQVDEVPARTGRGTVSHSPDHAEAVPLMAGPTGQDWRR